MNHIQYLDDGQLENIAGGGHDNNVGNLFGQGISTDARNEPPGVSDSVALTKVNNPGVPYGQVIIGVLLNGH